MKGGAIIQLIQTQTQKLSQQQLQSIELLQMSSLELDAYIRELSLENPLIEVEDSLSISTPTQQEDELLRKLRWLEDNDLSNRFYQPGEDEFNPLDLASTDGGLEETLFRFLSRQILQLGLSEDSTQTALYLASCLDDDGYFRTSIQELSAATGVSVPRLERGLAIICSLEPAGVGARDLVQCLSLQLNRIREAGPVLDIAQHHLQDLAKGRYRSIAAKLGIPVEDVHSAKQIIRELEPRPGAIFQRPEQTIYILPDIFIEEHEGQFTVRARRNDRPVFRINSYYKKLLASTTDREALDYLTAKLRQAEGLLGAIERRESTLVRCAQFIARQQVAFFRHGPASLVPLRMSQAALELELHESTISRAVREKYLQCAHGVYPMSYFFSRTAIAEEGKAEIGGVAARTLLQQLIDAEDKSTPLSDQRLCGDMAQRGCPISRRTVAKYREQLHIPAAGARKEGR